MPALIWTEFVNPKAINLGIREKLGSLIPTGSWDPLHRFWNLRGICQDHNLTFALEILDLFWENPTKDLGEKNRN